MIPLFYPQIFKTEWLEALSKGPFSGRWLGQGPLVDKFEEEFGKKFGYDYCLGTNSGSSALELAYHLIGIGEGDEVFTTVLTCTATTLPLLRRKADIKFVDISDNLTMDYADLYKKLTNKTKAIVVVTLGGLSVDNRIFWLANKYGIPVVIDAAQSVGISEEYGSYICYSFQSIKSWTCGDGGLLVLRNKTEYDRAKKLRWFGIDRDKKRKADWRCVVNHQMAMDIEEAGYKYHMTDIAASMLLVGLKHSDEILEQRKVLCELYNKNLSPYVKCVYGGGYWLFGILVDNRDKVLEYLRTNGIECDLVQLRNDIFTVFGGQRQDLPNMNALEDKYLYLPLNGQITVENVNYITDTVIRSLNV